MSKRKQIEIDKQCGERLTDWMVANSYSLSMVAEKTKASTSTVRTWKLGVRPSRAFRDALTKLVGWGWGASEGASEDKGKAKKKNPPRTVVRRAVNDLLVAREGLKSLLAKVPEPDANETFAVSTAIELLEKQVEEFERKAAFERKVAEIRSIVQASTDREASLTLLRRYESPELSNAVIKTLDGKANDTARAKATPTLAVAV